MSDKKAKRALAESLLAVFPFCFYCRSPVPADDWTLDHFLARSHGGTAAGRNMVLACRGCNLDKADYHPAGYLYGMKDFRWWLADFMEKVSWDRLAALEHLVTRRPPGGRRHRRGG